GIIRHSPYVSRSAISAVRTGPMVKERLERLVLKVGSMSALDGPRAIYSKPGQRCALVNGSSGAQPFPFVHLIRRSFAFSQLRRVAAEAAPPGHSVSFTT